MAKNDKKVSGSKSKIIPLGDRILLRPMTEDEIKGTKKVDYGIIMPDSVSKEKGGQGKVVAVGEGKYVDGKLIPVHVKVGDTVVFSRYSYDEVEHRGEEYYLLKEENILAIIQG